MRKNFYPGNLITPPHSTKSFVDVKSLIVSPLILAMPGIAAGQCPSSYYGYLDNDDEYSSLCGFRQVSAYLSFNTVTSYYGYGKMDVNFSSNAIVQAVFPVANYIDASDVSFTAHNVVINISTICEPATIVEDEPLVNIIYAVISSNSATAQTVNTRLLVSCMPITFCPNYSDASAITINVDQVELNGKVLAPGEFSCTGGNSTDNGLPARFVNVNMANSPYWNLCEDIETNGYGYYECGELREDCDYTICVSGPEDDFCGIDEFDQDIIRDLILGNICPFDYKWQHYAADANNDGEVSTTDVNCLERYIHDEIPYNIPLKWKYVSNTQYGDFTPICDPAEDRVFVPIVDNCAEINMDGDPVIEDWYGFPVGDLNNTCNSCGLRNNPKIFDRGNLNIINVSLRKETERQILIEFNHQLPVNIWSLVLIPDIPVANIISIQLNNNDEVYWTTNGLKNLLKISFVELLNQGIEKFSIKINLKKNSNIHTNNWTICTSDSRMHNIAIDQNKEAFSFSLSTNQISEKYTIFPNPTSGNINIIGNLEEILEFSIYQSDGKFIRKAHFTSNEIDVEALKSGIYFLKLTFANGFKVIRFNKLGN